MKPHSPKLGTWTWYGVAASPTLAGKHIFVVDDAGYTHLIQPGPVFKEVGKNVLVK